MQLDGNLRGMDHLVASLSQSLCSGSRVKERLRQRCGREFGLLDGVVDLNSLGHDFRLEGPSLLGLDGVHLSDIGRDLFGLGGRLAGADRNVVVGLGAVVVDIVADGIGRVRGLRLGHLLDVDGLSVDNLLDGVDLLVDDDLVVHVDQGAHVGDGGTDEGKTPDGQESNQGVGHQGSEEGLRSNQVSIVHKWGG